MHPELRKSIADFLLELKAASPEEAQTLLEDYTLNLYARGMQRGVRDTLTQIQISITANTKESEYGPN